MSLQNIYPSLQGGFGLLHRGEGLVQLPGGGGHLEPGHPGHPAPAPSQTCAGVRLREGREIWAPFQHPTLSFTVMPMSVRKIRAPSCERVSNSSSHPSSWSSSKIVSVLLLMTINFKKHFSEFRFYITFSGYEFQFHFICDCEKQLSKKQSQQSLRWILKYHLLLW